MIMNWMMETYHKNSPADEYWFGFVLGHMLYVVTGMTFEELARFFRLEKASTKKGGFAKIRIRARVGELQELLPRAILLGSEDLLTEAVKNKGNGFEKVIVERYTTEKWAQNSTPFFADGDATIGGLKVQIKLNGAELTNERMLRRHFG